MLKLPDYQRYVEETGGCGHVRTICCRGCWVRAGCTGAQKRSSCRARALPAVPQQVAAFPSSRAWVLEAAKAAPPAAPCAIFLLYFSLGAQGYPFLLTVTRKTILPSRFTMLFFHNSASNFCFPPSSWNEGQNLEICSEEIRFPVSTFLSLRCCRSPWKQMIPHPAIARISVSARLCWPWIWKLRLIWASYECRI